MAISNFIPEIWSARLYDALQNAHVAKNFVNNDYTGLITNAGDTVHITSINDVTIGNYTKDTDITAQVLTDVDNSLVINQAKYFAFEVDDIDVVQCAGDLIDKAMANASYGLNDVADAYLFSLMASGVDAGNVVTTTALTASNIYTTILAMRLKLDKANVPTQGRAIALPPEAYALLLQDSRFTNGGELGDSVTATGYVGKVAGFDVYETNNLPYDSDTSAWTLVAGVPASTTYAEQIVKTEAYRKESGFADGVKGLHVYGAKVLDGKRIATCSVTIS